MRGRAASDPHHDPHVTRDPAGPALFGIAIVVVVTIHFLIEAGALPVDSPLLRYRQDFTGEPGILILRVLPGLGAIILGVALWSWHRHTWPKIVAAIAITWINISHFIVTPTFIAWLTWAFLLHLVRLVALPPRLARPRIRVIAGHRRVHLAKRALACVMVLPLIIPVAGIVGALQDGDEGVGGPRVLFRGGVDLADRQAIYRNSSKHFPGTYAQLVRVAENLTVDGDVIVRQANRLLVDGGDFRMNFLLRMLYLDDESGVLDEETRNTVNQALLGAQYWFTQDGSSTGIFWTENHQIAYHAAELLAGQRFKADTFTGDGMTGEDHVEHATRMIERWIGWKARHGFSEWQSNTYMPVNMVALLNIVDFAENETLSTLAAMLLDLACFEFANNWFQDSYATTHGRCYQETKVGSGWDAPPSRDPLAEAAWMLLGLGGHDPGERPTHVGAAIATSTYAPPGILERIAHDASGHHEHKGRHGFDLDAGQALGVGYTEEELMFWWGAAAPVSQWTIDISFDVISRYGLDPGIVCGTGVPELLAFGSWLRGIPLSEYAGLASEITQGVALETANVYTYRTPYYQLSGVQDHQKGLNGMQEHAWQASLPGEARVFTNAPGGLNFKGGPFMGGWHPRATFHRNVGIIQYDRAHQVLDAVVVVGLLDATVNYMGGNRPYTHAYFPRWAFDDVRVSGSWVFGERDGGFVALYSTNPTYWASNHELAAIGRANCWIVELGSIEEHGSFDAFIDAIHSSTVHVERLVTGFAVRYSSPAQGLVEVGWDGPMLVNGVPVDIGPYDRWDNAYAKTPAGSPVTVLTLGNETLTLDFENASRIHLMA